MRLNLGAGDTNIEGFTALDQQQGHEIFPLPYPDQSVEEIRASHVLEHFPHQQVPSIVKDWTRALKPGGKLRIAVPNFAWIVEQYVNGGQVPVQGYVMGGQVNGHDYHKAIFDEGSLRQLMAANGLIEIKHWRSEIEDCAALPVSLNLVGIKPVNGATATRPLRVGAAMSVPRLGFMDNFFCAWQALTPLGITPRKHTGVFWGQCLERCIEEWLDEGVEWILTIDYDALFTRDQVATLLALVQRYENVDALAPIQMHRQRRTPLATRRGPDGKNVSEIALEELNQDIMPVNTAHFGLTLLRAEALARTPKPWFKEEPDEHGSWGDGHTDADIWFWRQWEKAGNTLFLANRVAIGHGEFMAVWLGQDLQTIYQHPSDFYKSGPPPEVWK